MSHQPTRKQRKREEQARRQAEAAKLEGSRTKKAPIGLPDYIRGLPPGLILAGVAFFLTPYFWFGVFLAVVGAVWLARQLWKDLALPKRSRVWKIVFISTCTALTAVFAGWILWPVPIQLRGTSEVPQFGPGSNLYGIQWSKDFSRLDFTIKNPTDTEYDDFDAELSTDLTFEGVKQTDGITTCSIAPATKVIRPMVQKMLYGASNGSVVSKVPVGPVETDSKNYVVVGIGPNGEITSFSGDTAQRYRIRCDKLPGNSENTFFAALSVINTTPHLKSDELLRGPAQAANWLTLDGKFTRLGRARSVEIVRCKMGQDCQR